jgi:hypothetical protein
MPSSDDQHRLNSRQRREIDQIGQKFHAPPGGWTRGRDSMPHSRRCVAGIPLIVWKLDRLGRDLRHLINVIHDLSPRSICRFQLKRRLATDDFSPESTI